MMWAKITQMQQTHSTTLQLAWDRDFFDQPSDCNNRFTS